MNYFTDDQAANNVLATTTPAFQKIMAKREAANTGSTRLLAEDMSSVIYYTVSDRGYIRYTRYVGRKVKGDTQIGTGSNGVEDFMFRANIYCNHASGHYGEKVGAFKVSKRQHTLEVGDVVVSKLSYESTSVLYHMVTKLNGNTQATFTRIGDIKKEIGKLSMSGKCVPDVSVIKGGEFKCKVNADNTARICDTTARPLEFTVVSGCKIYKASSWSSYG